MSGAELGLAIVGVTGAIDVCFKVGKSLVETCQAASHADSRLSETVIHIRTCWMRIELQLPSIRELAPLLEERHHEAQQQSLEVLLSKLRLVDSRLKSLAKKSTSSLAAPVEAKKLKYGFRSRRLAEAVSELDSWQTAFEASWYLLMTIRNTEVDRQLEVTSRQKPLGVQSRDSPIPAAVNLRRALNSDPNTSRSTVFLPQGGLAPASIKPIPFSPAKTAQRAGSDQAVLLDPISCEVKLHGKATIKDLRNFARRLQHTEPFRFGLLECKGLLKDEAKEEVDNSNSDSTSLGPCFVFRLPDTHRTVQSVRGRLLNGLAQEHSSLSDRFTLARQLAVAVSYVHVYGFVHKNIRPETILIISGGNGKSDGLIASQERPSETAVLIGFDVLRDSDGKSQRVGDDDWEKNLYRHPERQGTSPEIDYEMRHDIYSVGVCLLEIGLWETFVDYDALSGLSDPQKARLGTGMGLKDSDETRAQYLKNPDSVKDHLLGLAGGKLKRKMGTKYSEVVETCLTCLDKGNVDFGDEEKFHDEDGILVGARYIEKVVMKLSEIVV